MENSSPLDRDEIHDQETKPKWLKINLCNFVVKKGFRPRHADWSVHIRKNFHPGYRDLGRENLPLMKIFTKRRVARRGEARRGEISETKSR